MKAKTIEELIKHRIETYKEAMKKEEVKTDMYSQMYLRGAIEELKFIEQNIIQPEPHRVEEEITIFPEKEYHFQFRDLETLRGISDYKVSGKRLMQYLHNAELSLNNNKII